ncbi:MAG: prepilin-type N-terminal cleavage/methylation domain-containing protein [Planctomycetes bacterium]|nr:prepilin-type N-terminal cleavage/methylation domain-containing protein [Planctomycetota bacterium]
MAEKRVLRQEKLSCNAFTLAELMIVVVIISIAALLAVPMMSSAADSQLRSAVNMIAADLEYAKSMSISRQQDYSVVFDVGGNSYEIRDESGSVIDHPMRVGTLFSVTLSDDSRLSEVELDSVSFDSTSTVSFDYLGSPSNGSGTPLNSGSIVLDAGNYSMTITVQPVTGFLTIQ